MPGDLMPDGPMPGDLMPGGPMPDGMGCVDTINFSKTARYATRNIAASRVLVFLFIFYFLLRRSRAPECGAMPISWSAWRKAAMSMTPVAPGISRGLSFLSSLGRPAGASFTAAEMRERCRLQPGHVCEAAVLG